MSALCGTTTWNTTIAEIIMGLPLRSASLQRSMDRQRFFLEMVRTSRLQQLKKWQPARAG